MIAYEPNVDFDVNLESSVLGICLFEPTAYSIVYSMTNIDCYHLGTYRQIFEAMGEVFKDGFPIDLFTVQRRLFDKGIDKIESYDTPYFLSRMMDGIVNGAHLEYWCIMLRELAAKRLLKQITTGGYNGGDVVENVENINSRLRKIMEVKTTNDWVDNSQVAIRILKHMADVEGKELAGITTTIPEIDEINGGFREGQMIVVGARPGMGKSAFMGRLATRIANKGKIVGIMSLEMEAKDVMERMVSEESNVPFWMIDKAQFAYDSDRDKVHEILNKQSNLSIYYSEDVKVNIHDIRAKAEKLKREKGLDILIIDYLQLVTETGKQGRNREQAVSEISRGVKLLAMTLKIPVVVLAQLNRDSMDSANKKPQLHHMRESGSIEQDADIVILLHRDCLSGVLTNENGGSTEKEADILVRKWRNGATMEIKVGFEPDKMKFITKNEHNPFPNTQFPIDNPRAGIGKNNFNPSDWNNK